MKNKILNILKNSADYISGELISEQLGISRSAIWKNIAGLRGEGYVIDSVTNKGYKLTDVPDILNAAEISEGLQTEFVGRNIFFYSETDSTNIQAKLNSDSPDGSIFVAENQTAGKGRLGREWLSQKNSTILLSVLLKPDIEPERVSSITLIAGIAVCRTMRQAGLDAMIKWPNDIVVNGKKVCGILMEMSAEMDRVNYVVCGIGINVNNKGFDGELEVKATSMMAESGKKHSRKRILQNILYEFEVCYKKFLHAGIEPFLEEYKECCITLGREVSVIKTTGEIRATAVDVDSSGGLVIEKDGLRQSVFSGEVSVRGIFGYV